MVWGMSSKKKLLRRSHSSASTKLRKSESMTASTSAAPTENRLTEWSSMLHVGPSTSSTADESLADAIADAVGQVAIEPSSEGSQTARGHRPLARVSTAGGVNPYQCPGSNVERLSSAKLDATITQHSRAKTNPSPADDVLTPIRDGCSCITYLAHSDLISCIEFNQDGDLLATGDKGGRVVIFQRDQSNKFVNGYRSTDYNVYSTFQSHEPEFDYLKSLEIEEKINKVRWLKKKNAANFLLSTNDKTVKLWKISERQRRVDDGCWNTREESGAEVPHRAINRLIVPKLVPMQLIVEASPRRVYANAHTYHINSISVCSDNETYISADDLRINLWHLEITNQSFNIVDIKPANMEELTEVITAAEYHPEHCNLFVYSSSKGTIRMCDQRQQSLCDKPTLVLEEPEDPQSRSFFSEIISSISDVKFSHRGDHLLTRDYLGVKVWDWRKSVAPVETYPVHEYLRGKLCSLYENDCIFDKFECSWSGDDRHIITGSYNNFFRTFNRETNCDQTLEACPDVTKSRQVLKSKKVGVGASTSTSAKKGRRDEILADSLDFNRKILHTAWHPEENIIAVAATNNLYIFQDR